MILRRDPTKALQVGFLVVLVIATAQVAWWITDQRAQARGEQDRVAALYESDASAVTAFVELWKATNRAPTVAEQSALSDVVASLPHLAFDPAAGVASVRSDAIEELAGDVASRLNRYAWEGGFFLLVLLVGMGVLTRAIRDDARLRRRQQNFIAAVSHEFKSPLASMRLSGETLATRSAEPDSRRLGERMVEDGDRLLRMVDNLLDTARIDDGRIALRREPVPLREVVEGVIAGHAARATREGIAIRADVPAVTVEADPLALESVLRNLLDNAVKACIAGEGGQISIAAHRDGSDVVVEISDDGIGFPPGDAARIFEKFYRSEDAGTNPMPGTGLGLYVVRRLAEISDARVVARTEGPGKGATVTVTWPAARS